MLGEKIETSKSWVDWVRFGKAFLVPVALEASAKNMRQALSRRGKWLLKVKEGAAQGHLWLRQMRCGSDRHIEM